MKEIKYVTDIVKAINDLPVQSKYILAKKDYLTDLEYKKYILSNIRKKWNYTEALARLQDGNPFSRFNTEYMHIDLKLNKNNKFSIAIKVKLPSMSRQLRIRRIYTATNKDINKRLVAANILDKIEDAIVDFIRKNHYTLEWYKENNCLIQYQNIENVLFNCLSIKYKLYILNSLYYSRKKNVDEYTELRNLKTEKDYQNLRNILNRSANISEATANYYWKFKIK